MRRIALYLFAATLLLLGVPGAAQEDDGGNISRIYFFRAKPGMNKQLEEGIKKHMAWHRQQNDTWSWWVWEVVSGDNTGAYGAGTFGHKWSDFDNPAVDMAADAEDAKTNVYPYVQEGAVIRYHAHLPKVSKPAAEPSAMSTVIVFHVRYGKQDEFNHLIGKFHEAIEKTEWPVHYSWNVLVNGGEGGTYVLVLPRKDWASFAPLEKPFEKMLEEAYGRTEADSLLKRWSKAVKSTSSLITHNRPDLGYTPPGM